jgi:hypothetical protein
MLIDNDAQMLINVGVAVVGALGGWVMKFLYDGLKGLQEETRALLLQIQSVEVLVAGQYAKRTELDRIYDALVRIESKLDGKADR